MSFGLSCISVLYMPQGVCETEHHISAADLGSSNFPDVQTSTDPSTSFSNWQLDMYSISDSPTSSDLPPCTSASEEAARDGSLTPWFLLLPSNCNSPRSARSNSYTKIHSSLFLTELWLIQSVKWKVGWVITCVVKINLKCTILFKAA